MAVLAILFVVLAAISFIVACWKEWRTAGSSAHFWAYLGFVCLTLPAALAAVAALVD